MSNISKKTYVWVLLAMAVIMGSGLLYSANARAGEIVKTEKNGDEGTFPWQNEFTTTALNYESDTQKVTTQQKEETNVTTVVISDEKCVNATIKRAKIKKIKKKASNKISIKLKVLKGVNGYQIKISTSKKFKKTIYKKSYKKVAFTLKSKKFANKKKLYIKVRAYAVDGTNKIYGKWSKVKKVKIK